MSFGRARIARPIRPLLVLVAVSLGLVLGAQSAMASTIVNESGKTGEAGVIESNASPGVTCVYDADGDPKLDRIDARSPRVFARDRTAGRDGQWVGIKIIFQKSRQNAGDGGWKTVKSVGFIKKRAFDDQSVGIGPRSWLAQFSGFPHFRVRAKIRWYRPGTTSVVQGSMTLRYEFYQAGGNVSSRCIANE